MYRQYNNIIHEFIQITSLIHNNFEMKLYFYKKDTKFFN